MQEYTFIALDNFQKIHKNKSEDNALEAWLTFFTEESPERIEAFLNRHPEFRSLYEDAYTICENVEKVMDMFSKELRELDRNTVYLMIDELRETVDSQKEQLDTQKEQLEILKERHEAAQKLIVSLQAENEALRLNQ